MRQPLPDHPTGNPRTVVPPPDDSAFADDFSVPPHPHHVVCALAKSGALHLALRLARHTTHGDHLHPERVPPINRPTKSWPFSANPSNDTHTAYISGTITSQCDLVVDGAMRRLDLPRRADAFCVTPRDPAGPLRPTHASLQDPGLVGRSQLPAQCGRWLSAWGEPGSVSKHRTLQCAAAVNRAATGVSGGGSSVGTLRCGCPRSGCPGRRRGR